MDTDGTLECFDVLTVTTQAYARSDTHTNTAGQELSDFEFLPPSIGRVLHQSEISVAEREILTNTRTVDDLLFIISDLQKN